MTFKRGSTLRCGRFLLVTLLFFTCLPTLHAAERDLTKAYERAARIQAPEENKIFRNLLVHPRWLSENQFWYTRVGDTGKEWVLVEVDKAHKAPVFDNRKLAAALSKAVKKPVDHTDLPLQGTEIALTPLQVRFAAFGKQWDYQPERDRLTERKQDTSTWKMSPDGKWGLFVREHNLWVKELAKDEEKQLTRDGAPFYAYGATVDATGRPAQKPEAIWSADSKRILAVQTDDRQVKDLPMIDFAPEDGSVRPTAYARRTALPGDDNVTGFRMLAIDIASGKQVGANYRPLPAVRMNDTPISGGWSWWGGDGRLAYFVDIDRGEKTARVIEFNTDTGNTRTLFEEHSESYVELGSNVYTPTSILPMPSSNELIWYSERSGWAHLYLYDLATGKLKRALTEGQWLVRDVLGVDADTRQLYVSIAENESGKDPYYRSIARVGLDDGKLTLLSGSDADHAALSKGDMGLLLVAADGDDPDAVSSLSPGGGYYVEAVANMETLPRTDLRTTSGKLVMTLEQATAPGLPSQRGWPERVQLTAADGKTVISGVVFRPSDFLPDRRYPVIDYIYGGPQVSHAPESVAGLGEGTFATSQSLAELGFVVVTIDGRGTTERSRAFHEASYGAAHTASNLEDHIAGIRQLAQRYPYMDLDRVGIFGFSGGGYMTAQAMLRFPEFYKVGVAGAGNYDQRLFWQGWGERYQGLLKGDNYLPQATATYAKQLQGKLLFIHGLKDYGVHPAGLFQLTQALMDANKKFDLVIMPRAGHELPGYAMVRMWDYFVEHLAGQTPPKDFFTKSAGDLAKEKAKARIEAEKTPSKEADKTTRKP